MALLKYLGMLRACLLSVIGSVYPVGPGPFHYGMIPDSLCSSVLSTELAALGFSLYGPLLFVSLFSLCDHCPMSRAGSLTWVLGRFNAQATGAVTVVHVGSACLVTLYGCMSVGTTSVGQAWCVCLVVLCCTLGAKFRPGKLGVNCGLAFDPIQWPTASGNNPPGKRIILFVDVSDTLGETLPSSMRCQPDRAAPRPLTGLPCHGAMVAAVHSVTLVTSCICRMHAAQGPVDAAATLPASVSRGL